MKRKGVARREHKAGLVPLHHDVVRMNLDNQPPINRIADLQGLLSDHREGLPGIPEHANQALAGRNPALNPRPKHKRITQLFAMDKTR